MPQPAVLPAQNEMLATLPSIFECSLPSNQPSISYRAHPYKTSRAGYGETKDDTLLGIVEFVYRISTDASITCAANGRLVHTIAIEST